MSIKIGCVDIGCRTILAPMSGVTDAPFRRLARRLGAGLVVSEMIASDAMVRQVRSEMRKMSTNCAEEYPMAVQLAGCEPDVMAEAARLNVDRGAAIIDINFGCPAKKVVNKLSGSAIMRDEQLAAALIEATVNAVDVPVTLKMRTGWDHTNRNAPRIARIAEQSGIRMITVHGRTRCQFYKGRSDWAFIRDVKAAVDIPVVANGDVTGPEEAEQCLRQSGADGVMIGRGAQGRPWIVKHIDAFLKDGEQRSDPPLGERRNIMIEHYEAMLSHYGVQAGVRIARKHLSWYSHGFRDAAEFRNRVNRIDEPTKVRQEISALFAAAEERLAA